MAVPGGVHPLTSSGCGHRCLQGWWSETCTRMVAAIVPKHKARRRIRLAIRIFEVLCMCAELARLSSLQPRDIWWSAYQNGTVQFEMPAKHPFWASLPRLLVITSRWIQMQLPETCVRGSILTPVWQTQYRHFGRPKPDVSWLQRRELSQFGTLQSTSKMRMASRILLLALCFGTGKCPNHPGAGLAPQHPCRTGIPCKGITIQR